MNHPALKTRILLPAAALLGVLFAGFLYMTWTFQCNDLHSDFSAILESGKRVIAEKTETDARLLAGAIDDLTHNERMLALWRQRDRAGLQQLAEPLFTAIQEKYGVTHFYFHQPDRVCFLRVHQPDRFGDAIERQTLLTAEQSGGVSAGYELGPLGTLTLRVVKPWVIDGRVEGYLELGEEITQAANNVSSLLNVDVAVLIHKRCLDRVSWLHGMTLHNGSSDWNDLPDEVVVDRPATIVELPPLADVPDFNSAAPRGSSDLRIDGIPYLAGALPLLDIRGREVGRMVLLRNVATQAGSLHALMFRLGRYFAFLAAACLLGAFAYLNHVEKILCACHQRAVQAHEAREAAQAKHIEDTLLFRKAIEGATDAIALLGPERRLQYVNPAFEKLFGYTVNELTAQGGIKSLYADRKFAVRVYLQLSQGRSVSKEIEMLARENRRVHAFLRANPIFDGDKKMVGFLAVYTDLSERKSIERELLRQSLELADVNRTALKAQNSADAEQPA